MGLLLATAVLPLLFGLWAQMRVKRTFAKYSKVAPRNGMSGAEAAAAVLRSSGLPQLSIRPVAGRLTDHYDPRNRTLNLSADVGQASSLAAVGVAAHEAGYQTSCVNREMLGTTGRCASASRSCRRPRSGSRCGSCRS